MSPNSPLLSPQTAHRPFKRILIAVDPGGASSKAVGYAAHLCSAQTQVLVMGIFEDPKAYLLPHSATPADVREAFEELKNDELASLETARSTLRSTGAQVHLRLLGPALGNLEISTQLARTARDWDADLIVVGAERKAGVISLLATKVSAVLAEHTHRAILVVPGDADESTLHPAKRLLFAVDGSDAALHAVRVGLRLAPPHARLLALFVEDRGIDLAQLRQFLVSPTFDSRTADHAVEQAKAVMAEGNPGITIESLVSHTRLTEDVACAIKREAHDWRADIVVVGAEDRNGMFSWFRGHENERVAREIDRPLLVVNVAQ
ncbi:universal stress protein [Pandoraea commovens]|uniref:Universal stress protein n=1 Tax=Pandoraea commovens TaxID=2508289 RepID=A0ABY5QPY9_9BURK|nr:universal stress protein [Pandoraea commovens]UVA81955.1 universal stress protein [Pandoraea commovens]